MSRLNTSVSQRHPLHTAPCFHGLTKPFFRNPFVLTSIQNPGGVGVTAILGNSICSHFRDKFELSSFAATHPKNRGCGLVMVNHRRHSHRWNPVRASGVKDTVL